MNEKDSRIEDARNRYIDKEKMLKRMKERIGQIMNESGRKKERKKERKNVTMLKEKQIKR